jgi:hypothetical protein
MDNGEEIQGLNEGWTFMGCKPMELGAGLMMFMCVKEIFFKNEVSVGMPFMLTAWVLTSVGLRSIRLVVPDEERGVRNFTMVLMGFAPPGIPAPALIRDFWSGSRLKELAPTSRFQELGLDRIFPPTPNDIEDPIQPFGLASEGKNGRR